MSCVREPPGFAFSRLGLAGGWARLFPKNNPGQACLSQETILWEAWWHSLGATSITFSSVILGLTFLLFVTDIHRAQGAFWGAFCLPLMISERAMG